jgi:sugar phosphate isomerase/epimerase
MTVEYGTATAMVGDIPREEALRAIAVAGFKQVELSCRSDRLDDWPSDPAGLRRDLDRLGLSPFSVHPRPAAWCTASADDEERLAAIRLTCHSLECADQVGAELVIVHASGSGAMKGPDPPEISRARSRESLRVIADRAGELGLKIAVENLLIREGRYRPAGTVADVLELIDGLGEHAGVCVDTGHCLLNGVSAADDVRSAGAKLFTMHFQDNDGSGDQHLPPTHGAVNWDALFDQLDRMAYAGGRIFECGVAGDKLAQTLADLVEVRDGWLSRSAQ